MVLSAKVRYPGIGIFMGLKPQNNISFSKSTEINYLYIQKNGTQMIRQVADHTRILDQRGSAKAE